MEETLENDLNTGGILKEFNLSYYIGEPYHLLYIPIVLVYF